MEIKVINRYSGEELALLMDTSMEKVRADLEKIFGQAVVKDRMIVVPGKGGKIC